MEFNELFRDEPKITGPYQGLASGSDMSQFPEIYSLTDAVSDMSLLKETELILGIDGAGIPLTVDLAGESPHVLISAGTGAGKSASLRALAAQALEKGYQVVILDVKRHSHMWAENLPNVYIARTLAEIGNALTMIGQETHSRNRMAEQWLRAQQQAGNWDALITDAPVGRRTVVLFEEMNSTFEDLKDMTRRKFRNVDTYTAMDGYRDTTNMGRAAQMHMICVGQYMDHRTMGGAGIRANFSTRILVKHDKNAWQMLAWDCGFPMAAPEEPGRGYYCRGGKARMIQLLFLTERDAHEYVIQHTPRALTAAPTPELP